MSLFIILGFVLICAYLDYEHLKDNDYIEDHSSRVILRLWFCIFASNSYIELIAMIIFFASTFDNALNLMRFGYGGLFRLGKSAKWDKFWRKTPGLYKTFIVTSLIVSVYIFIS